MIKIDKSEKIARSKYFIRSHVKFVEKSHLARLSGGTAGPIRGSFSKLSTRARFSMELKWIPSLSRETISIAIASIVLVLSFADKDIGLLVWLTVLASVANSSSAIMSIVL